MQSRTDDLFIAQSALNTIGVARPLHWARHVRVYAEWSAGVSAGVVTVRHRAKEGARAEVAGTLSFVVSAANSLRVEGPIGEIEAEITTAVVGGTVTVRYIASRA